jgi:5-carboxymethyl-2-hydroxymuconate isomerase
MPHLTIQHSPGLAHRHDMAALCETLRQVMAARGCFPVGGIRVRAWPTPAEAIGDGHPDNTYADMILRIGAGRSAEVKRDAGDAIMAAAKEFFAHELARPHFALALEIVEIDANFSWKANSIHERIAQG